MPTGCSDVWRREGRRSIRRPPLPTLNRVDSESVELRISGRSVERVGMKRRRTFLNFEKKLEILEQLNQGKSGAVLAKEYGVGTSTISDIKRNGDTILKFVSNLDSEKLIAEKKTRKTAQDTDLDSRVYRWYVEEKEKGNQPSDSTVCAKALEVNKELNNGNQSFKASQGWLRHFKVRHGINETKEPKEISAERQFRNFMKRRGFTVENVYNVGDCGLFWKTLPTCGVKARNGVRIVVCTNANGSHKLPVCVFGQETFVAESDLLVYRRQNDNRFEEWLQDIFIPHVKHRQENTKNVGRILLTFDASTEFFCKDILPKYQDQVEVFAFPDESSLSLQPMEAEMKRLKMIYRKQLLKWVHSKNPYPIAQFLEKFTFDESISMMTEAWESIQRTQICKSWRRLLSDVKNEDSDQDGILEMLAAARKIKEFEKCDVEDIIRWVESDNGGFFELVTEPDLLETKQENEPNDTPSNFDVYQCLDTVIQWFTHQEECNASTLSILQNLRDLAAAKVCKIEPRTE